MEVKGGRKRNSVSAFLTVLSLLVQGQWNPGASDLDEGSSWVWAVSSKCLLPIRERALPCTGSPGQNLQSIRDSVHGAVRRPEADIAIAPPAGSLEKESEILWLKLVASQTY